MGKLQSTIKLHKEQEEIILKNLNEDGRLSCLRAFKVAKLVNLKPMQMSDACKSMNIKITNCELGVFGKLDFFKVDEAIYEQISKEFKDNTDVTCRKLWQIAQNSSLRKVGSTTKNSDVEVTDCQLGCFRKRKGHREIKD